MIVNTKKQTSSFEVEMPYFKSIKDELIKKYGEGYAVIKGKELAGVWPTRDDAHGHGIDKWGLVQFLVRDIHENPKSQAAIMLSDEENEFIEKILADAHL